MIFGAIEAGGTKFICCTGRANDEPLAVERIPTTTPGETFERVIAFFRQQPRCDAFGVASFGPLDLERGRITETPKPGWSGVDMVAPIRDAFGVPVAIDTDVNGAGLAEAMFGAGRGKPSLVYITVGTGIGGSTIVDGVAMHGASHTEMGHIRVSRHPNDTFAGVCRFHGDCLEGLASGPAVAKRGVQPDWDLLGFYIAQLCVSVTMMIVPHVIVIGGGLAQDTPLLTHARDWMPRLLAGYPADGANIVAPALGGRSGVIGALVLAERHARAVADRENRRQ